jgi:hypothetical protein
MSKTIHALLLFTVLTLSARAQIISKFTWESAPLTTPVTGTAGISVSPTATSAIGGSGGTKGINPGTGSHDINLVLAGSDFTLPGLDISVDFKKEENGASFFTLGSLDLGIATGSIYIKFLVKVAGSDVLVTANNQYLVPNDNAFHTYRFVYNNTLGKGTLSVDGTTVYTYTTTAGNPLSWTGATNATVGLGMDGSNNNVAELDNLIIQTPPILLPLELLSFDAHTTGSSNTLDWTTSRENNTHEFIIQRSEDGISYQVIGTVAALGSQAGNNDYQFTDNLPAATSYYRLKMTDLDGAFTYSAVKKLSGAAAVSISCYPNPVIDFVNVRFNDTKSDTYQYSVTTSDGKTIQSGRIEIDGSGQQLNLNLAAAPKGLVIIRVEDTGARNTATFKIIRK